MDDYPLIENHGLIGDLQTAALVTTDGTIDWFCCPGSIRPASSVPCSTGRRAAISRSRRPRRTYTTKQLYLPDTAMLDDPLHDRGRCRRGGRLHAGDRDDGRPTAIAWCA